MRACIRDDSGPPPDDERKGGSERAAERRGAAAMATTLSLSSPLFLATPPRARHVVSAGPSWSTANLPCKGHFAGMRRQGRKQHRSTPIVSLFGRKTAKKTTRETVVPDPDYRLPIAILGISGVFAYADNLLAAAPVGLLGLLLLFQEVKVGNQLQESGENVFVGGKNRWKYSTFVNWELWWPQFPILVYFKETQTKPEGQIHFFPVIFNGRQLYDIMVERAGSSETSGPGP
ncbi:uncharacterized protein LOC125517597 isoform X2 [Triticum urartu]|uniref:uncharacterized protein LOC125517597 isoform X2 n=1 Tax=Triticum urartu TaxID=4572 RepID=UPI002042F26B|nr:uncharacterized protein LOC125517597 isoform X2 [Triticum urartu]